MIDETESALLTDHPMVRKAYEFYDDWGENPFWRYVGMHQFNNGYMFYDDTYFIMGRPVNKDAPRSHISNPEYRFERDAQNCWFIWLYAGDVKRAFTNFPYWLPYFGYERRDTLHITDINRTMLKLNRKET